MFERSRILGALLIALAAPLPAIPVAAAQTMAAPDMVAIPGGTFVMGSSKAETDKELTQTMLLESNADKFGEWEKPQHKVAVKPFKIGKFLVTRADFLEFVNITGYVAPGCYGWNGEHYEANPKADWRNPGYKQTPKDPAVCVSYNDAQAYIKWISKRTGVAYRLPTEAEMEYATRAGTTTSRFWGDDVAQQCAYANGPDLTMKEKFPAWYGAPCKDGFLLTSPVGTFKPNPWGLYDMLGNVYQYVEDCWHPSYAGAPTDGSAWTSGDCKLRTIRGGSTTSHPGSMRSSSRTDMPMDVRSIFMGFRLATSEL